MSIQTKLRTNEIIPNDNICYPIGTILAVKKQYEKLGLSRVFSKHKNKGLDINTLVMALVSYKLTDNFSISKASNWINRDEVLDSFCLKNFQSRPFYRPLDIIRKNNEAVIAHTQDCLFDNHDFEHPNVN